MIINRFTPPHEKLTDTQVDGGKYFSNKIVILSFLLCVGVVYQHTQFRPELSTSFDNLHKFIFFIVETCVPFFFAISGYLFFRNYSVDKICRKFKSRVKTLLIPYLIWNTLFVAFMLVMNSLGLISKLGIQCSVRGIITAIINSECSPLWFVKYLMVFVVLSPVVYYLLRNKLIGLIAIFAMLALNIYNYETGAFGEAINVNANTFCMFNYQFVYYVLGAYGALCFGKAIEEPGKLGGIIGATAVVGLILLHCFYLQKDEDIVQSHAFRLLWIPAVWFAYDLFGNIAVKTWMKYSFFIYCSHMFIIYCIQGLTARAYPHLGSAQTAFSIIEYLIIPAIVVATIICVANTMKRYIPGIYAVVAGNRG